jgi:hypothetical protein
MLFTLVIFIFNNCSLRNVPPNANKNCVKEIYQTWNSGGAYIFESYNVTLHSPTDGTPGITYRTRNTMKACADGYVYDIIELRTGRAGGKMVYIAHGVDRTKGDDGEPKTNFGITFVTLYAHLGKIFVKMGQQVRRGDPIGRPDEVGYPKLLLKVKSNWESPDNWGPNHSLMEKRDELAPTNFVDIDTMGQKRQKQNQIIKGLYEVIGVPYIDWYQYTHNPRRRFDAVARWSLIEHRRYLECLYKTEPDKFSGLSSENFNLKSDEFYGNQPLVLSIPF